MLYERIPFEKIEYIKPVIAHVINGKRETMAQVKARIGCHVIVNGGTYNMTTYAADSGIKIDGIVIGLGYKALGFGINDEKTLESSYTSEGYKDYFGAFWAYISNGKIAIDHSHNQLTGRTGIGITDTELVLVSIPATDKSHICSLSHFMKAYFIDCIHAINLDGGKSSQYDGLFGKYASGRPVLWYLCIWFKDPVLLCRVVNVVSYLKVRSKPSIICKELGQLHTGDTVKVIEWVGAYAKITYSNAVAYVTIKYIKRVK